MDISNFFKKHKEIIILCIIIIFVMGFVLYPTVTKFLSKNSSSNSAAAVKKVTPTPTIKPTTKPTVVATAKPTTKPTVAATAKPTTKPTAAATAKPTTTSTQSYGSTFGTTPEEQKVITWITTTYSDPKIDSGQTPQFIQPLITSGLNNQNLPVDKITIFPDTSNTLYFWVIYEHFKKGDYITITWTNGDTGKVISTLKQQTGNTFGRLIVQYKKPASGWGNGRQEIIMTSNGVTSTFDFIISSSLQTTHIPYMPQE